MFKLLLFTATCFSSSPSNRLNEGNRLLDISADLEWQAAKAAAPNTQNLQNIPIPPKWPLIFGEARSVSIADNNDIQSPTFARTLLSGEARSISIADTNEIPNSQTRLQSLPFWKRAVIGIFASIATAGGLGCVGALGVRNLTMPPIPLIPEATSTSTSTSTTTETRTPTTFTNTPTTFTITPTTFTHTPTTFTSAPTPTWTKDTTTPNQVQVPSVKTYCLEKSDFDLNLQNDGVQVMSKGAVWNEDNTGWEFVGQYGRTQSKSTFKVDRIEFDVETVNLSPGVIPNLYFSKTTDRKYCDIRTTQPPPCVELDILECAKGSNGNTCSQMTQHYPDSQGGCGEDGCAKLHPNMPNKVHFVATIDSETGEMIIQQNDQEVARWNNQEAATAMQNGMKLYSTMWSAQNGNHWQPGVDADCPLWGNIDFDATMKQSHVRFSNVQITGMVVDGPEPAECETESITFPEPEFIIRN